jgi:hypothetical protein
MRRRIHVCHMRRRIHAHLAELIALEIAQVPYALSVGIAVVPY